MVTVPAQEPWIFHIAGDGVATSEELHAISPALAQTSSN
jgi:hypothetical protein